MVVSGRAIAAQDAVALFLEEFVTLAEALIERKSLDSRINTLSNSIQENLYRAEDEQSEESPAKMLEELESVLAQAQSLNVAINLTNVNTALGEHGTIMHAIAGRDALKRKAGIIDAILLRSRYRDKRTKTDDIKFVQALDLKTLRSLKDRIAAEARRIDMEIQKANWVTELSE